MISHYTTIADGEIPKTAPKNKKSKDVFLQIFVRVFLGALFTAILSINVWLFIINMDNGYRINDKQNEEILKLREEINVLRRDVNILKHGYADIALEEGDFADDDLMKEFSDFEKQFDVNYDYSEDEHKSLDVTPQLDDTDFDDYYTSSDDGLSDGDLKSDTTSAPTTHSEEQNERSKREVLAATIDGVPIIAESYAERKQRNRTLHRAGEGLKLYETLGKNTEAPARNVENRKHSTTHTFKTSGWTSKTFVNSGRNEPSLPGAVPTPVMSRSSRVMQTNEDKSKAFRRIVKKTMLKSGAAQESNIHVSEDQKPRLRHRLNKKASNLETMDERYAGVRNSMPAAHFHGDTSKYHSGNHRNFRGNHHLAHPQGHYIDWIPSAWVKNLGMEHHFHMHNGVLTIKEPGLYFIYAQIFYVDEHDVNTYRIYKNSTEIAQCTTMTHTQPGSSPIMKRNTCYTATIEYFDEGDKLIIRDIESMRYVYFENGKSFFGLYKISDAKIK